MRSKKLNAYRGPLSAEEIAAGMNTANANALRLVEDAKVLLAAGRVPTAASLAALSIEESGKASILRQLATAVSKDEIASAWKSYRSHTRKNAQWQLPALASAGARRLEEFRPLFDENSDHPYVLDQIKQLGFFLYRLPWQPSLVNSYQCGWRRPSPRTCANRCATCEKTRDSRQRNRALDRARWRRSKK